MTTVLVTPCRIFASAALAALLIAAGGLSAGEAEAQEFGDGFGIVPGTLFAGTCELPDHGEDSTRDDWHCAPSSPAVTQAGAHPDATLTFELNPIEAGVRRHPDGHPKEIVVDVPRGLTGNPEAIPKCPQVHIVNGDCPIETQVGVATWRLIPNPDSGSPTSCVNSPSLQPDPTLFEWFPNIQTDGQNLVCVFPIYNSTAAAGQTAAFGVTFYRGLPVQVTASVRPDDFGLQVRARQLPQFPGLSLSSITLWGVPGDPKHDPFRYRIGVPNGPPRINPFEAQWPADLPVRPFITNPTSCDGTEPVTTLNIRSWQDPEVWRSDSDASPPVTGCDQVPFSPTADIKPTSAAADSSSGLSVELTTPQNKGPENPTDREAAAAYWNSSEGRGTAHLKKAVVTLPQGVSINPSAATGLVGCSDEQIAVGTETPPSCPEASKIGSAEVFTPVLPTPNGPGTPNVEGDIYLGTPKSTDPMSGEMFRMFLVLRNEARGILLKIPGSAVADPQTGQVTATFDNNPQLPFETLNVKFKGGPRGLLSMPQRCGTYSWSAELTPWTAHAGGGGQPGTLTGSFEVTGDCSYGFSPDLVAGMDNRTAKGHGTFSFSFSRDDGEQWFRGLTAELPTGLLASVRGVPLCTGAQAEAGACPEGSRIGTVDASAGTGDPFILQHKGDVYLTEGYKGGPYGLAVEVPVEAGPFTGNFALNTILVRQAIYVDPTDAHVTVVSDPLPTIWHGIPLRARQITVNVDRPGFMINPTDCSPKQVKASIVSTEGAIANVSSPFQATDCNALLFRPKLAMRLTGRKQTKDGGHPGLRAVVTQRPGEANIKKAVVRLPLSLALDPNNAQALCEFEDGQRADCPASSIVGRAVARTPLLNRPLRGPVYFVKNVRIHPRTGNPIRTLPTLLLTLRGEIALNVRANSSVERNKLVSTFPLVPDAQISRFQLNLKGGKGGILVVTHNQDVCRGRQVAESDMDGHNGKGWDRNIRMKTPCGEKKPARLKIGKTSWSGSDVTVRGRIAKAAERRVKVTLRCGKTSVSKRVDPNRRGFWKTTLKARGRCMNAEKAQVTARYAGGPRVKQGSAARRIQRT